MTALPKWMMYFYGFIALLVSGYLAWSIWGGRPQTPSAGFIKAEPAVKVETVPGPTVKLRVLPKAAVKKKFPKAPIDAPSSAVLSAVAGPPAPDGSVVVTTIDTTTGEATTNIAIKEAPLFALERKNYLGVGYELHLTGYQMVKIYYKRDLFRVKDTHLQGETLLKAPLPGSRGDVESYVGGNIEHRW